LRLRIRRIDVSALEFAVRGYHDETRGDKLCAVLREAGFEIKIATVADNLGGLIETSIEPVDGLEWDRDEIRRRLYAAVPDTPVFVQWKAYEVTEESEV